LSLLYDPADRDAELNRLKALAEKLANKVNAPGDTPEARLGTVVARVLTVNNCIKVRL
jgi:hypothetical protein